MVLITDWSEPHGDYYGATVMVMITVGVILMVVITGNPHGTNYGVEKPLW